MHALQHQNAVSHDLISIRVADDSCRRDLSVNDSTLPLLSQANVRDSGFLFPVSGMIFSLLTEISRVFYKSIT